MKFREDDEAKLSKARKLEVKSKAVTSRDAMSSSSDRHVKSRKLEETMAEREAADAEATESDG